MAKPKRRKATLHSAGKVTEQELLERARELYDDPSPVIPVCEGPCGFFSPVKAARAAIPRVHAARDDEAKLLKLASRGNDLSRALAATLLLAKSGKIPFVADVRLGGETVPYVIRGKAKPLFLAGVQHHDDRALRLLAVANWARKRKLHFYSADRGIVCTGKRPAPPADFLAEEAAIVDLHAEGAARYTCGHDDDAVIVRWAGTDVAFDRCETCAGDGSLLATLRRHVAAPRVERQFEIEPRLRPLQGAPDAVADLPEEVRTSYLAGRLNDRALLAAARQTRIASLRTGGANYVAGDVSYGGDVDAFLAALGASPEEARALRAGLSAHGASVVLDRASLARAVFELWPIHGRTMLVAVSDEATTQGIHKEKVAPDEALELIRKAARAGAGRAALSALPAYDVLPPAASAADAIARVYRGEGREAAVRAAQERASIAKAKGVALAMLSALQARQGQDWRFSESDREVAAALAPHVETLLRGDATSYHDALVATSRGSGETADVRLR